MRAMRHLVRAVLMGAAIAVAAPAAAQFSDAFNFIKSVRDRDVLKARSFIEKPGSVVVNTRDTDSGDTALIITVRRRDAPWMAFLLQNGADPNLRDRRGDTPLIVAASTGFPDGIRILLAAGAQVDGANSQGETALTRAVHMRDATTAQLLLNAGANPDRPDNLAGMSARDYAARDVRTGPLARLLAEAPKRPGRQAVGPSL